MTYGAMKNVDSMGETGFTGRIGGTGRLFGKFERFEGPVGKSNKLGQARGESSSEVHYHPLQMATINHQLYDSKTCKERRRLHTVKICSFMNHRPS